MHTRHEWLVGAACLTVVAATLGAAVALAQASRVVQFRDARGDVTGALDLQRVAVKLAADGRLRAVVTLAAKVDASEMLAGSGPPGSVCLKVWTAASADPAAAAPDHLVCITARSKDELRASVLEQAAPGLPAHAGSASVRVTKSARSLVLRVSQSALGRPDRIRFAVESTRPGCERVSCIDAAPDGGDVRRFRLR